MTRRVLSWLATILVTAAVVSLIAQNLRLRRELEAPELSAAKPPSALRGHRTPRVLIAGETVNRFVLTDGSGNYVSMQTLLNGHDSTLIHFFNTSCAGCQAEAPIWAQYMEKRGANKLLFVAIGEKEPVRSLPDLPLVNGHIVTARGGGMRDGPVGAMPPHVPYTVSVDACGTVTRVFRSASDAVQQIEAD